MNELLPLDSYFPTGALRKLRLASAERCGPIDARIATLDVEYDALTDEYNALMATIPNGFFARLGFNSKLRALGKRMNLNREMLEILYHKRIANT